MKNAYDAPEPEAQASWPDDALHHRLVGDWFHYQRKGGHRASTDDVVTAWHACRHGGRPGRYLDLGCGVGSVLLTVVHRLRPAYSLGVEAQGQSAKMLRRALGELPDPPAIELRNQDFRSLVEAQLEPFELITGSPPYFPIGTGVLPSDSQRRACRFEVRGGVEAYCDTAAPLLAPGGRLHLVFQTTWDARVLEAGAAAGLKLHGRADLFARADQANPFLTVYEFRKEDAAEVDVQRFSIRDADGTISERYAEVRASLGYER